MEKKQKESRIQSMFRVRKLCRHLDDFISSRDVSRYNADMQPFLRKAIRANEIPDFMAYFKDKTGDTSTLQQIEDEISDGKYADFLGSITYTSPYGSSQNLISLGPKGRQLLRGSYLSRWAYFIQFAFTEHNVIWTFVLGGLSLWAVLKFLPDLFVPVATLLSAMHI